MENFFKYKKIYGVGHDENKEIFSDPEDLIVIEEKIDGGNFRFMIKDGNVIIGSRTQQLTSDEGEDSNMNKMFKRCADFVREQLKDKDLKLLEKRIFYGENCVKHTMNYDWDKIPPYLGFDIYCLENNKFLADKKMFFEALGLPTVPTIKVVCAKEIIDISDDLVPMSVYASESSKDQKAEGIVFKNYSKQIMAKYVRDKFKEANAECFGGSPKYNKVDDTNNAEFVFKFCTNARIDKMIFKLIDEGFKLEMGLMKELPKRIYLDIWDEHWQEIRDSNWKLNMKSLRRLVPKRCRGVLQQVIVNNGLNGVKNGKKEES